MDQVLNVGNTRQEIEQLVVGDAVRPQQLSGKLVNAPRQDQVAERDGIEQDRSSNEQDDRQIR